MLPEICIDIPVSASNKDIAHIPTVSFNDSQRKITPEVLTFRIEAVVFQLKDGFIAVTYGSNDPFQWNDRRS